jgi:hypothetical protein
MTENMNGKQFGMANPCFKNTIHGTIKGESEKGHSMTSANEDDHTANDTGFHSNRACFKHDTNQHWRDDMAYVQPNPSESPFHYSDMIELLTNSAPDNNPSIYRFALIMVDNDGNINAMGSPGSTPPGITNLLSRAIGLLSFQQIHDEYALNEIRQTLLASFDTMPHEDTDGEVIRVDDTGGQYI